MDLSRRDTIRAGAALAAAAAVSRIVAPSLAQAAVSASTTLTTTYGPGPANPQGYRKIVGLPGEPRIVRTDLGVAAGAGRASTREALLSFVQLSDVHVVDHQSPGRLEWVDRIETTGLFSSSYRPQEMLTAQVADAMVQAVNAQASGPVTGLPFTFVIETGDNSDNCQYNEIRWNIGILDGGTIRSDSGALAKYEGVADNNKTYYDVHYWHPDAVPAGKQPDIYKADHGFPTVPGLLDAARRPFTAPGLDVPWYTCFGNHDGLMQGNFPHTVPTSLLGVGSLKVISPPTGLSDTDIKDALASQDVNKLIGHLTVSPSVRLVRADYKRRTVTRKQIVDEHFHTTGAPVGHGFTSENRKKGTAYYYFDQGKFRHVVMDTVNPNGYDDGSLDSGQFTWLKKTVEAATGKAVIVYSHHTVDTMTNPLVGTGGDLSPRVLGGDVASYLLTQPRVIAWVNGHTHKNQIFVHSRGDGSGGFWEINTASHCDYPQQARIIEITDNHDGTLSIFTTILNHAGPADYAGDLSNTLALASLSRELSVNDPQANLAAASGTLSARNTELLVGTPADF
ncbi:TIGR03767 family metallophosphoesterase [Nocardioides panacisoli]|uniref:TIGR03767 family metallophosphoesterase n=1 Tax=Nocardioides panacisoli TaxID=627624 RepID=A0ABP7HWA9_9ACTN